MLKLQPVRTLSAAFVSAALLAATPQAQVDETTPAPRPGPTMPDAVNGEEAIARLGDNLPTVATRLQMEADELIATLRADPHLWLNGDDTLLYVDRPAPQRFQDTPPSYSGGIPTSEAFNLHSNPGSNRVIYLDFDGHHSKGNGWGHNIVFPAWNNSGSSSSFSTSELESIIAHWEYISEDFSSWDVDVTTVEPPIDDILRTIFGDQKYGVRCLMTQITSGFGSGSGGIAVLGSFGTLQDTPVFVFNKGDNTGSMSASHEVGHAMNLVHDGLNGSTYHPGTGSGATSWGPIMGAPFGSTVVHWSNGDYAGATSQQGDLQIIQGSPTDIWADDYPDTVPNAAPLPVSCPDTSLTTFGGLIRNTADVDAWFFDTTGGNITITANPHTPGPNLDIELALYDGSGALLETDNPSNATNASISRSVSAGTYTVTLEGVGKSGSYSDYGSIGQYTLTVSAPTSSSWTSVGSGLAGTGGQVPLFTGTGVACEGNNLSSTLSNALPNATAWLIFGFGQLNLPFKGGVMIPDFTNGGDFLPIPLDNQGSVTLPTVWPPAIPAGLAVDFQYWVEDPGGPKGFSASNGLELVTP
jgi:hypothetical protein